MSASPRGFYLGLVVIVLGVGLLKPNVSAMVADLYPEGGARLDAGFTVFYMGINLGATLGPFVTGGRNRYFGPRAGFGAAAICMALGVLQYYFTQHHLGNAGRVHGAAGSQARSATAGHRHGCSSGSASDCGALALTACSLGWIPLDPVDVWRRPPPR